MAGEPGDSSEINRYILDCLLTHLQDAFCWPGADGLTVHDALGCYRQAAAFGRAPSLEELVREDPEYNRALQAFFRDRNSMQSDRGNE